MGLVYLIENIIDNKKYIGITTRSLDVRMKEHCYRYRNTYLQNAIKKYGIENFRWKILEKCNSKKELDEMEFHYIKQYNTYWKEGMGYNCTYGGDGRFDYTPTKETRKKISESNKGKKRSKQTKKLMSKNSMGSGNNFYGKKHSEESKKKMSNSLKKSHPMKGKHWSEETKKKISESLKGRKLSKEIKKKISESLMKRRLLNG